MLRDLTGVLYTIIYEIKSLRSAKSNLFFRVGWVTGNEGTFFWPNEI